jgi:predicted amidohydrolase YtcJ
MFFILALLALLQAQRPVGGNATVAAETVFENARIYTGDPALPRASALATRDGRIIAIGDDLGAYIGRQTHRVDLKGATLIPGLIDSHAHMGGLGELLESFDLRHVATIDAVAAIVQKEAAKRKRGEWIRGRNWDQTNWGGRFPASGDLDRAAPEHPVSLTRVDGHASWVNRKALELAGITAETPDPPGGKIIRDAKGQPTGVLIDRAQALVSSKIPEATDEQIRRRIGMAAKECARLGLTGVHDAGIGPRELAAYRELIRRNELPVRIYAMIGGEGPLWHEYLKKGPEIGDRLTVRSIKLMADGAMGSRGAAFWQPYSDEPGNRGLLILDRKDIERVARAAVKAGFQVNTHAIGDRANRVVLEAYAAVLDGKNDKRFRIEHAQVVALPDFNLFAQNSVIASMQSTHATSDMRWAEQRLGPDRIAGAYSPKRFLRIGVPVANGSDFPVEDANPLWGFYAAVTRQNHAGEPKGGWLPDQLMTREETLKSWTFDGAFAAFEEDTKGTLAPGKLADFVVLSQDIMKVAPEQILKTEVLMTVLGGEMVYSKQR